MSANIEKNLDYYNFLSTIQLVSKNTRSVQMTTIKCVFENYDVDITKKKINAKISRIDSLLKE